MSMLYMANGEMGAVAFDISDIAMCELVDYARRGSAGEGKSAWKLTVKFYIRNGSQIQCEYKAEYHDSCLREGEQTAISLLRQFIRTLDEQIEDE